MLTVKTYIAPAGQKGIGLFAAQVIPKGTVWWIDEPNFNKIVSKEEYDYYPPLTKEFINTYASLRSDGTWYLYNDNARFQNHSNNPNTSPQNGVDSYQNGNWITTKDIQIGEELTSDYRRFCLSCKDNLCFENKE